MESDYSAVWDRFREDFHFRPSVKRKDWPGIKEPVPSVTYSISSIYSYPDSGVTYTRLEKDLNQKTLAAFRRCVRPGEMIYALDWQHQCYFFDPHKQVSEDTHLWKVPVLPNGDYYIFLAQDFRFGIFGHPWEQTMCIFGSELLKAFESNEPQLFNRAVRKDGKRLRKK